MTEEEIKKRVNELVIEVRTLFRWREDEIKKIDEQLKKDGLYKVGLDTNQKYYIPVILEYKRRWKEIMGRYKDLPSDTWVDFSRD